jgi:16S rRNA (uracil1498-N3)-methyltransferase
MRLPRIYQNSPLAVGQSITLDERATKHLLQVLRFETGREIILFNGLGNEFKAHLQIKSKREAQAEVFEEVQVDREAQSKIHLAQCVSKGDRFEYALKKSVELGVTSITPVFSARSQIKLNHERKDKKQSHWRKIILSACEQSGRTALVIINEPVALVDFVEEQNSNPKGRFILHPEGDKTFSGSSPCQDYTLLVGPEGGFEAQEVELAKKKQFTCIRLGKQILRTETAPIAAISAIHMLEKEF